MSQRHLIAFLRGSRRPPAGRPFPELLQGCARKCTSQRLIRDHEIDHFPPRQRAMQLPASRTISNSTSEPSRFKRVDRVVGFTGIGHAGLGDDDAYDRIPPASRNETPATAASRPVRNRVTSVRISERGTPNLPHRRSTIHPLLRASGAGAEIVFWRACGRKVLLPMPRRAGGGRLRPPTGFPGVAHSRAAGARRPPARRGRPSRASAKRHLRRIRAPACGADPRSADAVPGGQGQRRFDDVLEFPDVSRPVGFDPGTSSASSPMPSTRDFSVLCLSRKSWTSRGMSSRRSRRRWESRRATTFEAIEQVGAEGTPRTPSPPRSRWVRRDHANVHGHRSWTIRPGAPPCSGGARRSLAWTLSGISPTSSRNSVPRSAIRNRPR